MLSHAILLRKAICSDVSELSTLETFNFTNMAPSMLFVWLTFWFFVIFHRFKTFLPELYLLTPLEDSFLLLKNLLKTLVSKVISSSSGLEHSSMTIVVLISLLELLLLLVLIVMLLFYYNYLTMYGEKMVKLKHLKVTN